VALGRCTTISVNRVSRIIYLSTVEELGGYHKFWNIRIRAQHTQIRERRPSEGLRKEQYAG
jgi:hypothetical protein